MIRWRDGRTRSRRPAPAPSAPPSTRSWATRIGASEAQSCRRSSRAVARRRCRGTSSALDRRRVVVVVLGRIDLGVGHRPDHVGDRCRERPERRHRALAGLGVAGVGHQRHDHELAVVLLRHEGHRRRGHDVGDRRELVGRRLGRGDEAGDRSRRVAGRISMPPTTVPTSCERNWKRVATPKLPPPPRIAQKRSGWCVGVDVQQLAVGGHDLGGEQAVDGQPVLADQVADAAAQRDAADADRAGVAEADGEAMRADGGRELGGGQAGLGPGRAPRRRCRAPSCRAGRARSRPRSTLWPAPLWPPLRTASSSPVSRASADHASPRRRRPRRGR